MSISNVGGAATAASAGASGLQKTSTENSTAVQNFLNYMKESPAERMEDAWLNAHGMTRQELAAMSPAKQQAVMDQMKQDIEQQLKQSAQNTAAGKNPTLPGVAAL